MQVYFAHFKPFFKILGSWISPCASVAPCFALETVCLASTQNSFDSLQMTSWSLAKSNESS